MKKLNIDIWETITHEVDENSSQDVGLDWIEQERSLARACRPELNIEFVGLEPPSK